MTGYIVITDVMGQKMNNKQVALALASLGHEARLLLLHRVWLVTASILLILTIRNRRISRSRERMVYCRRSRSNCALPRVVDRCRGLCQRHMAILMTNVILFCSLGPDSTQDIGNDLDNTGFFDRSCQLQTLSECQWYRPTERQGLHRTALKQNQPIRVSLS